MTAAEKVDDLIVDAAAAVSPEKRAEEATETRDVTRMSLSTPTISRLPKIQAGLRQGLTQEQIADHCGVSRRTIIRDMQEWVQSGLFETWLKLEFVELYEYERTANPTIAFNALSRLMGKMVTRKAEIKTETKEEITHKTVIKVDSKTRILLEQAARDFIEASHQGESASIH